MTKRDKKSFEDWAKRMEQDREAFESWQMDRQSKRDHLESVLTALGFISAFVFVAIFWYGWFV